MQRFLRYSAGLCVSVSLLGLALVGCSHSSTDFTNMSKADQIKAAHNLPPQEIAITQKMRAGILASMRAHQNGSVAGAVPPTIAPPSTAQH